MSDQWGAGDPAKWRDVGMIGLGKRQHRLVFGEHPHSRSDNTFYAIVDDQPVEFDGHRALIDVRITSRNYLKESHFSGDEIRKGGSGEILADGEVIHSFFFRDPQEALLRAHSLIGRLHEAAGGDWIDKKRREALVNRKIYYREVPAIVSRLIVDQGCLILETESGKPFPEPIWREKGDEEYESTVKVDVLDPHIWWWRD